MTLGYTRELRSQGKPLTPNWRGRKMDMESIVGDWEQKPLELGTGRNI